MSPILGVILYQISPIYGLKMPVKLKVVMEK